MSAYTYIEVIDKDEEVIHRVDVSGKSERSINRIEDGMLINLNPDYDTRISIYAKPQPLNP